MELVNYMNNPVFTGAAVAIVTPFSAQGNIDYEMLDKLIEYQIKNGTDAIVACGTTGEASTLTDDEHKEVIEFIIKKVHKRVPVIAGTGSNDTLYSLELSKFAKQMGADAHLQVTPYYNKTTQKGIVKHFEYIADRVELPMILYNVPSRTGLNILPETYAELAKHTNIVAVKEANGDIAALTKTMNLCGNSLDVYSGDDTLILPVLALGGKGVISVLSNIMPRETHNICELFFEGECKKSADLQKYLIDIINSLFVETNPIPIKAALNLMGINVGECRLPLCNMSDKNHTILKNALREYSLVK
ncbi:MAG: dapA [Clostridia bacterium]|jgi:4-hydroxy-tetrahydrodipicolinate synthase|nr:dapA [Clostridia bacterium]